MNSWELGFLKNKKIYVYGLGVNAKRICDSNLKNNIQGLIALDEIGRMKYGFEIFSLKAALQNAETILIAATKDVTDIVFQRIKSDVPNRIPIYNLHGVRLNGKSFYRDNPYWKKNMRKLRQMILGYDIISFDFFDTLVMRKCFDPTDVFILMEKKLRAEGIHYPIANWRKEAEDEAKKEDYFYSFDFIYDVLQRRFKVEDFIIKRIKECELEIEELLLQPRNVMIDLLEWTIQQGKQVYVLSDMYLPKRFIERLLIKGGAKSKITIMVSCEYKASKSQGNLFGELKKLHSQGKIMHIGDNYEIDCLKAMDNGIDYFYILSGKSLLEQSSISFLESALQSNADRIFLGLMISYLFDNPFLLSKSKGKFTIDKDSLLAYTSLAALTFNYISYVIKMVKRYDKSKVLFVSRDGYFLRILYEKIRRCNPSLDLPESLYFYSSRAAATGALCTDPKDIHVLLSDIWMFKDSNLKRVLEKRFHVAMDSSLDMKISLAEKKYGREFVIQKVFEKDQEIYENALVRRDGYKKYLKHQHITANDKIILVDLVTRGTTAYALSRLLDAEVNLVALGGIEIPNAYCPYAELVSMLYGNLEILSEVNQFYSLLELAYASREGQLECFDANGSPQFVSNTEYNHTLLDNLQTALMDICLKYMTMGADAGKTILSYKFVSACLKTLYPQFSDINDVIVKKFDFYDPLANKECVNVLKCKL